MTIEMPTPALLPSLRRLWHEAFGDGEQFFEDFMRTVFSPDRARCIVDGGEAVAALYWFDVSQDGQRLAYLYAVATKQTHRGQGLCRRLLEDTHAHLAHLGYAGAILVPSEPSLFGFYARFGYEPCAPMQTLSCEAGTDAIAIYRVTAEEYGARRAQLLPHGGVVQEGACLRLLETQEILYAGEHFLLAAHNEGDGLVAAELLGDTTLAPRIVHALGCTHGRFRTAGGTAPFAMVRRLTDPMLAAPTYFSLAFD